MSGQSPNGWRSRPCGKARILPTRCCLRSSCIYPSTADLLVLLLYQTLMPYFAFIMLTSLPALARGQGLEEGSRCGIVCLRKCRGALSWWSSRPMKRKTASARRCGAAWRSIIPRGYSTCWSSPTTARTGRPATPGSPARVVERSDPTRRSKGYAIEDLIRRLRATGEFDELDAIVVVDADSTVDPGLLRVVRAGARRRPRLDPML